MMRKRISSAHILAIIAIVLALGGNAVAFQLGKNTVGSNQLKRNAVTTAKIKPEAITGAKIKNATITGAQINSSELGTVPNAVNAQTLDSQSASQLAGASKLHCPSGTRLYSAICFEDLAQSPVGWSNAASQCWQKEMRLPTVDELVGFEINTYAEQPAAEWTTPLTHVEGNTFAWVASGGKNGDTFGSTLWSEQYPYRCVTPASN